MELRGKNGEKIGSDWTETEGLGIFQEYLTSH